MNKLALILLIIAFPVLIAAYFLVNKSSTQQSPNTTSNTSTQIETVDFENPKKSAHYETNTPKHGEILAGVPINVVIDFNFDLAPPSEIKIEKDPSAGSGQEDFGVGETTIDDNKLTLRRAMDPAAPDGKYTVNYNACWPDGSCHDGHFQFAIDRSLESSFQDLTGQSEVTINMTDIKFTPPYIKVSKGTKITWVNNDSVDHFVNTESHPAHTYYLSQNSRALKNGDTYSVVFDTAGIYPYHCSAHAASMIGSILVE